VKIVVASQQALQAAPSETRSTCVPQERQACGYNIETRGSVKRLIIGRIAFRGPRKVRGERIRRFEAAL
jgi:hypothetical protein